MSVTSPLISTTAQEERVSYRKSLSAKIHGDDEDDGLAEMLVGTHSYQSIHDMDPETRSRLLMQSSFSQRFSFVNPNNSAALSTFLLLNTMIGSGILNQPYVFEESGILGGVSFQLYQLVSVRSKR